jgi:hypothetical protein
VRRSALQKANLLLLMAALIFGQVGAGFFHNTHDAHKAITEHSRTVLVPHGEHCKICSVDWVHAFVGVSFDLGSVEEKRNSQEPVLAYSIPSSPRLLTKDRAPPVVA